MDKNAAPCSGAAFLQFIGDDGIGKRADKKKHGKQHGKYGNAPEEEERHVIGGGGEVHLAKSGGDGKGRRECGAHKNGFSLLSKPADEPFSEQDGVCRKADEKEECKYCKSAVFGQCFFRKEENESEPFLGCHHPERKKCKQYQENTEGNRKEGVSGFCLPPVHFPSRDAEEDDGGKHARACKDESRDGGTVQAVCSLCGAFGKEHDPRQVAKNSRVAEIDAVLLAFSRKEPNIAQDSERKERTDGEDRNKGGGNAESCACAFERECAVQIKRSICGAVKTDAEYKDKRGKGGKESASFSEGRNAAPVIFFELKTIIKHHIVIVSREAHQVKALGAGCL